MSHSLKQVLGLFLGSRIGGGAGKSGTGGAEGERVHTVAGKWPDAVEPLNRRLIALDAANIHRS
jgi:hypothetical protein